MNNQSFEYWAGVAGKSEVRCLTRRKTPSCISKQGIHVLETQHGFSNDIQTQACFNKMFGELPSIIGKIIFLLPFIKLMRNNWEWDRTETSATTSPGVIRLMPQALSLCSPTLDYHCSFCEIGNTVPSICCEGIKQNPLQAEIHLKSHGNYSFQQHNQQNIQSSWVPCFPFL